MARICVLATVAVLLCGQVASAARSFGSAKSSTCSQCLFAMRLADDLLADPDLVSSLVELVDKDVCPAAAGFGPKCHNLAEGLIPVIIQWAKAPATAWQLCRVTGACAASDQPQLSVANKAAMVQDDPECMTCRLIMAQAQHVLNDTTVLQRINDSARQACQMLPEAYAPMCIDLVSEYEPILVNLIRNASPKELCMLLAMCGPDAARARLAMSRLAPTAATKRSSGGLPLLSLRGGPAPTLKDSCDMCKMAVIEAHSLVANPQVQASLINYTKAMCTNFPSFTDTCELYVDSYAPMVFTLLQQYLVPDLVCGEIGVCKQTVERRRDGTHLTLPQQRIKPLPAVEPAVLQPARKL